MLGQGGMGTVYKAHDRELDRTVALKVIRPDLAGHPKVIDRFKQELILARQITHKNVIRIFDLGSSDSLKYITMQFIDGRSLASIMDERRLSISESISIVRQICSALNAAHSESVIHRDLKPQNIMIDATGKVFVMDFGLARSVETANVTHTGAVLGTPGYMSPEQVHGAPLDARSDLFAVGIILYELLTGKGPYAADTVVASLVKRTQHLPPPPSEVDPQVPRALSDVVMKCLAIDRDQRYAGAADLKQDLEAFFQGRATTLSQPPVVVQPVAPPKRSRWIELTVGGVLLFLLGGVALRGPIFFRPRMPVKPVTVLVADFTNSTGDPVFEGTLEPMFNFAMERAGFITTFNRAQARKVAGQLQLSSDKLDLTAARLIAVRQGLNVVISGSLGRVGDRYSVSATAVDAVTGKQLATASTQASTKEEVLAQIPKLVSPIRNALGDVTPESVRLGAVETFTAGSIAAAHEYAVAQDLMFNAQYEKAKAGFAKALELDPNFGRAYASMGVACFNLGQRAESEKYLKLAMSHLDRMTERERFRTRGAYYIVTGNNQKCVDEFTALVTQFPSDPAGHNNLALCQVQMRMLPQALAEIRKAIDVSPNYAMLHSNLAVFSAYAGDPQLANTQALETQKLNPSHAKSFMAIAFSQMLQGHLQEAAATYEKLGALGAKQRSLADAGLADLAVYEGRFEDAVKILTAAASVDEKAGDKESAALKYVALANAEIQRGQGKKAIAAADNATSNSKSNGVEFLAARTFAASGETSRARAIATRLNSELAMQPQVHAKLIEGEIDLQDGNGRQAVRKFSEANRMLDTWIGHFDLGRAYLQAGAFTEADSEFDRCIQRKGEALALFLDESPTFGYFPPTYYYVGRVREELKNSGFAESYRTYLAIRGKAGQDPLIAEINRRVGR
jgi:tetratricopeptide (TPR) repeat protein